MTIGRMKEVLIFGQGFIPILASMVGSSLHHGTGFIYTSLNRSFRIMILPLPFPIGPGRIMQIKNKTSSINTEFDTGYLPEEFGCFLNKWQDTIKLENAKSLSGGSLFTKTELSKLKIHLPKANGLSIGIQIFNCCRN